PRSVDDNQRRAYDRLIAHFNQRGLPARWYTIPSFDGYRALTGQPIDVHCVEAHLGASPDKPGYDSYALAQTFLPAYPSLALVLLAELRRTDRQPSAKP